MIDFTLSAATGPRMGLIVLRADETIEAEFRHMMPRDADWLTTRIASGAEVTAASLAAMETRLTGAAGMFPDGSAFNVVGYACTSGTAQIGADRVAARVRAGAQADNVTDPVTALIAACDALGVASINILSPYVADVSERLCAVLAAAGLSTPHTGSFDVATEAVVARIDTTSLVNGGLAIMSDSPAEALFISCTNLRTLTAIPLLEARLRRPVLTSNQLLAWHMQKLSGAQGAQIPGQLGQA